MADLLQMLSAAAGAAGGAGGGSYIAVAHATSYQMALLFLTTLRRDQFL
jgi:hypothetical protein